MSKKVSVASIRKLVKEKKYADASALAIFGEKTEQARTIFSQDKSKNNEKKRKEKFDAFENLLLADAKTDFDCYNRYLDYRQPLARNLYIDRRKYMKEIADAVTNMYFPKKGEESYDVLRIKLRTRSAKSELLGNRISFWVQGNFPMGETLHCVGGGALRDSMHAKRLAFIDEYWNRHMDVFNDAKVIKDSKLLSSVWLSKKEYADISTVTIGGSIEGHVQCTNLLVLDDLVGSNEVNSARRLKEIYETDIISAVMRRYISGKMILIGTPFASSTGVPDPLDAFFEDRKRAGYKCKEFSIPSLDENGESNYAYRDFTQGEPIWRFTTEEFQAEKRAAYESENSHRIATFETVYQMKPMDLGEKVFSGIQFYDEEPDAKYREINVFDPADSGEDSAVMFHCRIYDGYPKEIYVVDIFKDRRRMATGKLGGYIDKLIKFFIDNQIHELDYEANTGGTLLGETLTEKAKEENWNLICNSFKTSKNKKQKIFENQGLILEYMRFKRKSPSKQYESAVEELMKWSESAPHDDVADCASMAIIKANITPRKQNTYLQINKPIM